MVNTLYVHDKLRFSLYVHLRMTRRGLQSLWSSTIEKLTAHSLYVHPRIITEQCTFIHADKGRFTFSMFIYEWQVNRQQYLRSSTHDKGTADSLNVHPRMTKGSLHSLCSSTYDKWTAHSLYVHPYMPNERSIVSTFIHAW